jgi:hypothetical protein
MIGPPGCNGSCRQHVFQESHSQYSYLEKICDNLILLQKSLRGFWVVAGVVVMNQLPEVLRRMRAILRVASRSVNAAKACRVKITVAMFWKGTRPYRQQEVGTSEDRSDELLHV